MRRSWLAPEVVQTSMMDCGPAALKCLLEGHGVPVSYGRLREACQTDVDGTSIDAIEDAAVAVGLRGEQVMMPVDHVLLPEAGTLPAIAVVQLPDGATHFVVVWRRHGALVQIMDPAEGRRWVRADRLLSELYVHTAEVDAAAWREWAGSSGSVKTFRRRLREIGVCDDALLDRALADDGWCRLATLDAAVRLTALLVRSGGLRRGREAGRAMERFCAHSESIPAQSWSVSEAGENTLRLRGAVLVSIHGVERRRELPASPELAAALTEPPLRPGRELLRLLRTDGVLMPGALACSLFLAASGVAMEAVLLRGFFEVLPSLGLAGQRAAAAAALAVFSLGLLLIEAPLAASLLRYGRRLEIRLRQRLLEKIPRLSDRYFQSRPASDMADRSHTIHKIRRLPVVASQFARGVFELLLTVAGIAWLDHSSAVPAAIAAAVSLFLPLAVQPAIRERDFRQRTHAGGLGRFYLDSLLGLTAIQAHGAERAIRRGHSRLLGEWARAGISVQRTAVAVEVLQSVAGYGLAAWLFFAYLSRHGEAGGALLLAYWALNLPFLGQQIASAAWQYPALRNVTLRLLEPLGALEESSQESSHCDPQQARDSGAARIAMESVTVVASGQTILDEITLDIAPGSSVAIVGASGAGKSSLAGLLLGWHRATEGRVLIDGLPLEGRFEELRSHTAWVDPTIQLWNRSLFDNLRYGAEDQAELPIAHVMESADVRRVLEKLPDGLESRLGEGGALVSGGEGQRVRLGRAMMQRGVRLVILDEPFRGLDDCQRRDLLNASRRWWAGSTLLYITHDIAATLGFERVLVMQAGKIVEDGRPVVLASQSGSRYRALLNAEREAREELWSGDSWRRVRMDAGRLREPAEKEVSV